MRIIGGDRAAAGRESATRSGLGTLEAMAMLATPVLQLEEKNRNKGGSAEKVISRITRRFSKKSGLAKASVAGAGDAPPAAPLGLGMHPILPARDRDRAGLPPMAPDDGDGGGAEDPRLRKRGGLRELRNNIKVLKRQQAAKAAAERAAAEAETSGLTESETAPVRVDSSATGPSMSGAANDAYDTPMSGGSGSGRPRSARTRSQTRRIRALCGRREIPLITRQLNHQIWLQ